MNPVHRNFSILLDIKSVTNKNIIYVSELTPDRSKWYKWVPTKILKQICYQIFTSLDMTKTVFQSRKVDAVFIFEHKPQYSLLLYFTCILKNVPVFFIVHGIQQSQKKSIFHFCGVEILRILVRKFKFWPIHLEISDKGVPGISHFSKSIVTLHPLAPKSVYNVERKNKRSVIIIGIVGMLRNDKPVSTIIEIVSEYIKKHDDVKLYIGTPFWQEIPENLKNSNINLVDTTSNEQYLNFLKTLDIVITDFANESFYFRPSGIINDSISCGCFVIAPDYPVFKAQLFYPIKVGETYKSLSNLDEIISNAIYYINSNNIDFNSWIDARSDQNIINHLSGKMIQIMSKGNLAETGQEIVK